MRAKRRTPTGEARARAKIISLRDKIIALERFRGGLDPAKVEQLNRDLARTISCNRNPRIAILLGGLEVRLDRIERALPTNHA